MSGDRDTVWWLSMGTRWSEIGIVQHQGIESRGEQTCIVNCEVLSLLQVCVYWPVE